MSTICIEHFRLRGMGGAMLGASGSAFSNSVVGAGFRIGGAARRARQFAYHGHDRGRVPHPRTSLHGDCPGIARSRAARRRQSHPRGSPAGAHASSMSAPSPRACVRAAASTLASLRLSAAPAASPSSSSEIRRSAAQASWAGRRAASQPAISASPRILGSADHGHNPHQSPAHTLSPAGRMR